MKYTKKEILDSIKGGLIISCQALPGEPLYVEEKSIMYLMARAAKLAGAKCIRTNSFSQIQFYRKNISLLSDLLKQRY